MTFNGNLSLNRYEWASSLIDQLREPSIRVFDIGARDGIILNLINKPIDYVAFDLEPLKDNIIKWDLNNKAPSGLEKANLILLLDVIEHLNNPWICMQNLSSILKVGGKIVITTPNPYHSEARFTLFTKGWMPCFTVSDLELNHHVFTPWPHVLEKLLLDNGLVIEHLVTLDGETKILDRNLVRNPFRIFKRLIKKVIESNNKMARGMSYGIIAKKVNG
jgi:SAM-dependent methyltransferase